MSAGVVVLLAAVAVAVTVGGLRAATAGRFRAGRLAATDRAPVPPTATAWHAVSQALGDGRGPGDSPGGGPGTVGDASRTGNGADRLGERATLVQFSSAFCAPCRATRRVLGQVVDLVPGVVHVEIDAEQHLDLVRELGVVRTPTTLVLDHTGAERTRAVGAPTQQQVLAALV